MSSIGKDYHLFAILPWGSIPIMRLLPSSIRTAGRSILRTNNPFPQLARLFSSTTALTREQVEEKILGVLKAFDRVNTDNVL